MNSYFLHKNTVSIDNKHNENIGYEYDKFIYLVSNKIKSSYITGIKFSENFSDINLCPHDTTYIRYESDDVIECSEKTFDNYTYKICNFIKIHDDSNLTIWINEIYKTQLERDIKIEKILIIPS